MNLIVSYGRNQDMALTDKGAKFLGAAKDKNGNEVHIFQVIPLELYKNISPELSLIFSKITENFVEETKGE